MNHPVFVITGAPNKGKSTLVRALTNDESVEVNHRAGTTFKSKAYPMSLGGNDAHILYTIWDTPGFGFARGMAEVLKSWGIESSRDDPLDFFRRFLREYADHEEYTSEIEIFRPITGYAGIVYVADSSRPFNETKYRHEIELLKWTGLPRIAVLNPIEGDRYQEEWQRQMDRHFRVVKIFNPHQTGFHEKLRLLDAFSHMNPKWESRVLEAIDALKRHHEAALRQSAVTIRKAVLEAYKIDFSVPADDLHTVEEYTEMLFFKVRNHVARVIDNAQKQIVRHYGFKEQNVQLDFDLHRSDIMDAAVMRRYLSLWQKGVIAALTGAGAGAGLDLAAGGLTFGVFTALGGVLGAAGSWLSHKYDPMTLIGGLQRDKNRYEAGKLHPALGFLIINRLRDLVLQIGNKTAANPETIRVDPDRFNFDTAASRRLNGLLKQVSQQGRAFYKEETKKELGEFIYHQLKKDRGQPDKFTGH